METIQLLIMKTAHKKMGIFMTRGTNDYLQAIKHQLNGPCLLSLPLVATLLLIVYKLSQALNKTAQKYNLISLTF